MAIKVLRPELAAALGTERRDAVYCLLEGVEVVEVGRPALLRLSWAMASVLDLECARLRALTATEKVAVMHSLWRQAWSLKSAGVAAQHPDWSPEQVAAEVRAIFRRDVP